jgi:hypothetical protein
MKPKRPPPGGRFILPARVIGAGMKTLPVQLKNLTVVSFSRERGEPDTGRWNNSRKGPLVGDICNFDTKRTSAAYFDSARPPASPRRWPSSRAAVSKNARPFFSEALCGDPKNFPTLIM